MRTIITSHVRDEQGRETIVSRPEREPMGLLSGRETIVVSDLIRGTLQATRHGDGYFTFVATDSTETPQFVAVSPAQAQALIAFLQETK